MIAENVKQYDGVQDKIVAIDGTTSGKTGEVLLIKRLKSTIVEATKLEWLLFEKCIRGDTSDNNVHSLVLERKGSKNKTGMLEAFEDRNTGGFNYNNFMLQRWVDRNEEEHRVKDDYERNRIIDLTQSDEIKEESRRVIQRRWIKNK